MSDIRISEIIAPSFYDVHRAVREHKYTEYMLGGGRGSTKSSYISIEIPLLIKRNPDVNAIVLRKVANTLRSSVFEQILWGIDVLNLNDEFKATVSPMEITYIPTGQKIVFRGLDDRKKLKSTKIKRGYFGIIWYEELDEFSGIEEIRNVNQSMSRGGDKFWRFYSYNPPKSRDSWVNVEKMEDKSGRLNHHSTYLDVPAHWLGQTFIDDAEDLKARKPIAYEHEYMGVATGTGGQVFDNIKERRITQEEINSFGYFYDGIDFGFTVDPLAWVKVAYNDRLKTLYFLDEIYQIRLRTADAVTMIRQRNSSTAVIYADCEDPRTIDEMREYGLNIYPVVKPPGSVKHGIKWLQDLNEIVIDKSRTPNTYREFTLYEYEQTKDGQYISRYPDKNNHTIDSARYALYPLIAGSKINTLSIKSF